MMNDPGGRTEEFIQVFNRVENFLSSLVASKRPQPFASLVDNASLVSGAVRTNNTALKQFAKLRNAIVHDPDYPPNIVAVPSPEALLRFRGVAQEVMEPNPLIPTFAAQVRCFSPDDTLSDVLKFMRHHDFSHVAVRGSDRRLKMITVEGITRSLADEMAAGQRSTDKRIVADVLPLEPRGCFVIMGSDRTVFDAGDAFSNSIHIEATRLYAILVTKAGSDSDEAIGFVTPWDLVHNPRLVE
jgi:hypothetical protein